MKKGFGLVNRAHVVKELGQAGDPLKPLADFTKVAYGQTLKHTGMYNTGPSAGEPFTIDMPHGVVQGDPIAPVLFALSVKAALECARGRVTTLAEMGQCMPTRMTIWWGHQTT